ncbi:hypothetical protein E2C01_042464 [Portunus trituberculatus]|uniref:Uncharacterized protein n=1 Tax=Portunus trituberculatus TaxID=210409 RepID=A0A5B7FWK5_PORTR|nr:hypothetical protein [Portunus trituberculatus]
MAEVLRWVKNGLCADLPCVMLSENCCLQVIIKQGLRGATQRQRATYLLSLHGVQEVPGPPSGGGGEERAITTRPPGKPKLSGHEFLPDSKENAATTTSLLAILPDDVVPRLEESNLQGKPGLTQPNQEKGELHHWMKDDTSMEKEGLRVERMSSQELIRGREEVVGLRTRVEVVAAVEKLAGMQNVGVSSQRLGTQGHDGAHGLPPPW